jgi:hypothetical protein
MRTSHGMLSATTWTMLRGTAGSQYPPSKPAPTASTTHSPGYQGVAFTGADIGLGAILAFGLVMVGAILLLATRRRVTKSR